MAKENIDEELKEKDRVKRKFRQRKGKKLQWSREKIKQEEKGMYVN